MESGFDPDDDDENSIKPAQQYVYFYLPSEFQREFKFSTPDGSYGEVFGGGDVRSLFVGQLYEGRSHTVALELKSDNLYVTQDVPLFYYLDVDLYIDVMTRLAENQLVIDEGFTDDHITGTITTTDELSTVFTSIPYDEGWIVKVDGKRVDTIGILGDSSLDAKTSTDGALVAFEIEGAGEHTVELIYRPKAFVIGATVSVVGLIVFLLLIIFEKKVNRISAKILFPLTVPVVDPSQSVAEAIEESSSSKEEVKENETEGSENESEENGDN